MPPRARTPRAKTRRPRPRRLGLSRQRIADAALALVDREGLAALTARTLARDLDCEAMSLYHHFGGMEDLQDAVADSLLAGAELPRAGEHADLESTLRSLARGYLALAASHPRAFPLIAARRLRGPAAAALVATVVERLGGHGLAPVEGLRVLRILVAYLNGAGLALSAWAMDGASVGTEQGASAARREPAAGSETLAPLGARLGLDAVREDLERGLDLLVASLAREPG